MSHDPTSGPWDRQPLPQTLWQDWSPAPPYPAMSPDELSPYLSLACPIPRDVPRTGAALVPPGALFLAGGGTGPALVLGDPLLLPAPAVP